jgi:flagellar basal body-associated protein FliL
MKEILNKYGVYIVVALLVGAAAFWWVSNKSDTESKNVPAKASQVESPQPTAQPAVGTVTITDDKVKPVNPTVSGNSDDRSNEAQDESSSTVSQPQEADENTAKNKENTFEQ